MEEEEIPASVMNNDELGWNVRNAADNTQTFSNACARLKWQSTMFSDRVTAMLGREVNGTCITCHGPLAKHLLRRVDALAKMFPDHFGTEQTTRFADDCETYECSKALKQSAFESAQRISDEIDAKRKNGKTVRDDEYDRMYAFYKDADKPPLLRDTKFDCNFTHVMTLMNMCIEEWLSSGKYPPPQKDQMDHEQWWKAGISEKPDDPTCGIILWQGELGRFISMFVLYHPEQFSAPLPDYDYEGRVEISMSLLNLARTNVLYSNIYQLFSCLDEHIENAKPK
jgi:hypothetical protein